MFAERRVMKEITRSNYLKALRYSRYCPSKEKELLVVRLIRNDFKAMYSNLEYISEEELSLLIDYMQVLSLRPEVYLKVVEKVRDAENIELTRKLEKNIEKPAWKIVLRKDLHSFKDAE